MHVLVIGASGFLGYKLVDRLVSDEELRGSRLSLLTLADVNTPTGPLGNANVQVKTAKVDITDPASVRELLESRPDVIFHLAGVMSGDAEEHFSKGYTVNVDGTRNILETIRLATDYTPRLIFTSSVAVFGPPFPEVIEDSQVCTPRCSYGAQKAISELLVDDYSRKGFVDGISLRLPTIVVRPGEPNKAASSFFSGIIREPLANMEAICPVPLDLRHTVASPRAAVGYLIHAASLAPPVLMDGRTITMPGVSLTVGEMIESLVDVSGKHAAELIRHKPDPFIKSIVSIWPSQFDAKRALGLGFVPDPSYDDILKAYIAEDLGGWKYQLPSDTHLKPVGDNESAKEILRMAA